MPQHHHQQPPHVFAPIVGGALVEERERAAKAVADKRVAGRCSMNHLGVPAACGVEQHSSRNIVGLGHAFHRSQDSVTWLKKCSLTMPALSHLGSKLYSLVQSTLSYPASDRRAVIEHMTCNIVSVARM